ncbi:MAG: serine protein kinase, partial [Chloroflexus sp.]|nr:serine protein kinase [Chloroflexus sp.]
MNMTLSGFELMKMIGEQQDRRRFQQLNWRGTFAEYLDIVARKPQVARNAFQRVYDMIMSYGTEEFIDAKKRLI